MWMWVDVWVDVATRLARSPDRPAQSPVDCVNELGSKFRVETERWFRGEMGEGVVVVGGGGGGGELPSLRSKGRDVSKNLLRHMLKNLLGCCCFFVVSFRNMRLGDDDDDDEDDEEVVDSSRLRDRIAGLIKIEVVGVGRRIRVR